jgi:outer membrane protein assembly factor BamA
MGGLNRDSSRGEIASGLAGLLLATLIALAAQGQTSSPASVPDAPSATLFGTNTNLEGSSTDKGAMLGAVSAPSEPVSVKRKYRGEFAFAPIPMINPSIGNGGGAALMYSLRMDEGSPPSSFGAGGFGTGRGSWGFGLGTRLYLKDDRYRILTGGGGGEFNYNFFGVGSSAGQAGISIPLSQRSRTFLIEPKIRIYRSWYLGPRYHFITNHVSLGSGKLNPSDLPIPLPIDLKFTTAALGLRLQRDTSDSPFYPRHGSLFDLSADFFDPAFGADRNYKNLTISYDKYISVGMKNVFAIHGSVCTVTDKAPFFDVCEFGMSQDIRGYQVGQYRDDRMTVGQAEYRRELFWRLGAVAFAGVGAVGKTFDDFGSPEPGGGAGLRLTLAKSYHVNLRIDYA